MRGAPDRRTPHFSTITPPTGFLPKPVAILLPPGPTPPPPPPPPPETPESTLTVVMVPSYHPPTSCWSIAFFVLLLSPFCLAFCSVSVIPSPPLSSPLLAFLPAIHSILVSTPEPPLFFPLVISPHHSLSWNLHLEPPTPLSVHLHQEFQHSSLLPIATAPS